MMHIAHVIFVPTTEMMQIAYMVSTHSHCRHYNATNTNAAFVEL